MSDDEHLEHYKRFVAAMLKAVDAVENMHYHLHTPFPHDLQIKKHYYALAQKQLDADNLPGYKMVLDELKSLLKA